MTVALIIPLPTRLPMTGRQIIKRCTAEQTAFLTPDNDITVFVGNSPDERQIYLARRNAAGTPEQRVYDSEKVGFNFQGRIMPGGHCSAPIFGYGVNRIFEELGL
ncbi:hypothetical protein J4233_04390 [Candidatus Pacearchaeota archaeon]|nr:hypothetical protein [Candidatus Pacearchaeota archaeon]